LRAMTDLPDGHQPGVTATLGQYRRADQMIVQDDVCISNELERANGEEPRISRTCAHQIHNSVGHRFAAMVAMTTMIRAFHRSRVSARRPCVDR
jgi:hypothetical protein